MYLRQASRFLPVTMYTASDVAADTWYLHRSRCWQESRPVYPAMHVTDLARLYISSLTQWLSLNLDADQTFRRRRTTQGLNRTIQYWGNRFASMNFIRKVLVVEYSKSWVRWWWWPSRSCLLNILRNAWMLITARSLWSVCKRSLW